MEWVFGGGDDVNATDADVDVARISAEAVMSPRAIVMVRCDGSMMGIRKSQEYIYKVEELFHVEEKTKRRQKNKPRTRHRDGKA